MRDFFFELIDPILNIVLAFLIVSLLVYLTPTMPSWAIASMIVLITLIFNLGDKIRDK